MDQQTIRKLRHKFMINSMLTLVLVMAVSAGLIFVVNLVVTRNQIRETMDYIAESNGEIQDAQVLYWGDGSEFSSGAQAAAPGRNGMLDRSTYDFNEFIRDVTGLRGQDGETQEADGSGIEESYYIPYFAVSYRADGTVEWIKMNHMEGLTLEEATGLADYALRRLWKLGQYGDYYYNVRTQDDGSQMVIYLNSSSQVNFTSQLLYSALILTLFGAVVVFLFVWFFSTRAVGPLIRGAELQQQFITNASHELKTPLAVIKANTEMEEMISGESEWTASTLRQVDRMNALIQNLVTITRAQENDKAVREEMDVSVPVKETAETYLPVAQQDGKLLEQEIPEGIRMKASDAEIRQLTTLLLDNAIKYCDEGGTICVRLSRKGKETTLCVSNSFAEGMDVDYSRFFERFYRGDEAHTVEGTSGFGIGLSIAQSLTESYSGSIRAEWKDGVVAFICVLK